MDNRRLFGIENHENLLYLSAEGIHKMGDHGPNINALETGNFFFNNGLNSYCVIINSKQNRPNKKLKNMKK